MQHYSRYPAGSCVFVCLCVYRANFRCTILCFGALRKLRAPVFLRQRDRTQSTCACIIARCTVPFFICIYLDYTLVLVRGFHCFTFMLLVSCRRRARLKARTKESSRSRTFHPNDIIPCARYAFQMQVQLPPINVVRNLALC